MCCFFIKGIYVGALLYQSIKLPYVLWFAVIRKWYKGLMARILDGDPEKVPCWLRGDFIVGIAGFDRNWGERFDAKDQTSVMRGAMRVFIIVCFGCTLFWDDLVTVFWLATRTEVSWGLYSFALATSISCEFMKTTLKLKTCVTNETSVSSIL